MYADVSMVREVDEIRVMAYFVTTPQTVNEGQDVDLEAIVANLNSQLENWNLIYTIKWTTRNTSAIAFSCTNLLIVMSVAYLLHAFCNSDSTFDFFVTSTMLCC